MNRVIWTLGIAVCGFALLTGCSSKKDGQPAETNVEVDTAQTESVQPEAEVAETDAAKPVEPDDSHPVAADEKAEPEVVEVEFEVGFEPEGILGILPRPYKFSGVGRWQVETTALRHPITTVAWSPDGRQIARGTSGPNVRIYDAATLQLQRVLVGHTGGRKCVAWCRDSGQVASASGNQIRLWGADGTPGPVLEGHSNLVASVTWSPDGKRIVSGGNGNTVRLWLADGTPGLELQGHTESVNSIAWSPDGERLASASSDKTVRLWQADGTPGPVLEGHTAPVRSVAWSPDGQQLVSGSSNGRVQLWRADGTPGPVLEGHSGYNPSVAWSPDGDRVASGNSDGTVHLWDVDGTPGTVLRGQSGIVKSIDWSPTGQQLVSSYNSSIQLWGADGTPGPMWVAHAGQYMNSVSWSPDARWLASGGHDSKVRLWQADGTPEVVLEGHTRAVWSVAWSPDGQRLASGSDDKAVRLWKVDGTPGPVLPGHTEAVRSVGWSPDGQQVASASRDATVRLWQADGTPGLVLEGTPNSDTTVSWSHDGRLAASYRRGIQFWESDGAFETNLHGPNVWSNGCVAWRPDARRLVSAGVWDQTVRLWEIGSTKGSTLRGHTGIVVSVAVSADGKQFASGAADGTILIWDADSGAPQSVGVMLPEGQSAGFSADGQITYGDPEVIEKELVYLVENPDGSTELLKPSEFRKRAALPPIRSTKTGEQPQVDGE